jgi:taurine-pyruvate aminotransferase
MAAVIAADKAHVWHHLIQHKPYEQPNATPRIIVHGSGMRVRDAPATLPPPNTRLASIHR